MDTNGWPEKAVAEIWRLIRRFSGILDFATVADVLGYTVQKCKAIRRDANYIPILFENELEDYIMRRQINMKGAANERLDQNSRATA